MSGAICSMEEQAPKRTRRRCPHCQKMGYGTFRTYYDTWRMFFDCGTCVDYGYGVWYAPAKKRVPRRQKVAA